MTDYEAGTMRIRITTAPPVETKHGITEGREFEVLSREEKFTRGRSAVILGDADEEITVFSREYQVVEEDET